MDTRGGTNSASMGRKSTTHLQWAHQTTTRSERAGYERSAALAQAWCRYGASCDPESICCSADILFRFPPLVRAFLGACRKNESFPCAIVPARPGAGCGLTG